MAKNKKQRQATSGKEWRKPREEGFLFRLPSGKDARIAPVALDTLLANGWIPQMLEETVAEVLYLERDISAQTPEDFATKGLGKILPNYMRLANAVVPASLRDPVVVENPQANNEVSLADIDPLDKLWILNHCILPVEVLRGFCEKQERDVAALSGDTGDEETAVEVAQIEDAQTESLDSVPV